jgi:lysyl-tRNA synthetase class 2
LRQFLNDRDFLEVETPVLQPIPGGANARPFVTHHNALDVDLYLRIAPELYLKRLLVGGFEKIYEIARCFRNEGIDYAHNPEFTQIELYWAYAEREAFISFMEEMIVYMVAQAIGAKRVEGEKGAYAFEAPFPRITFRQAIIEACGIDINEHREPESLVAAVKEKGLSVGFENAVGIGEYYDELYKKTARVNIDGPVWVLDYPVEMKPLANTSEEDPTKSAAIQLVIGGAEIVNAYYHELHDPIEQRQRFVEQQKLAEQGSEEAQKMDEGFLEALEHGMPPACGFGMGLDRLAAILTGSHSLKEVILFPTLRPRNESDEDAEEGDGKANS